MDASTAAATWATRCLRGVTSAARCSPRSVSLNTRSACAHSRRIRPRTRCGRGSAATLAPAPALALVLAPAPVPAPPPAPDDSSLEMPSSSRPAHTLARDASPSAPPAPAPASDRHAPPVSADGACLTGSTKNRWSPRPTVANARSEEPVSPGADGCCARPVRVRICRPCSSIQQSASRSHSSGLWRAAIVAAVSAASASLGRPACSSAAPAFSSSSGATYVPGCAGWCVRASPPTSCSPPCTCRSRRTTPSRDRPPSRARCASRARPKCSAALW
mmetsp:Transcript_20668/g.66327  ORF Transcript_20668/g.66327 Transcript_20668/m.66327 type:complete len:275 (-) Transcript_20668:1007-1831(-)